MLKKIIIAASLVLGMAAIDSPPAHADLFGGFVNMFNNLGNFLGNGQGNGQNNGGSSGGTSGSGNGNNNGSVTCISDGVTTTCL